MSMQIQKADGTFEEFEVRKLQHSLKKAGATATEIKKITDTITKELFPGMRTGHIYRKAFSLLRKNEKTVAAKYSLRRALFGLGPTGFPFEDFIARLLEKEGYTTKTRVILRGKCVEHEIDVLGYNQDHCFIAEAKFHLRPGIKSDLQVALYSHARFLDLEGKTMQGTTTCPITKTLIVTNTKFSHSAVEYAQCAGIDLLSWNYPKENNLQKRIERAKIYPITVLPSLTTSEKKLLLAHGFIFCSDLMENRAGVKALGLKPSKIEIAIEESSRLCNT